MEIWVAFFFKCRFFAVESLIEENLMRIEKCWGHFAWRMLKSWVKGLVKLEEILMEPQLKIFILWNCCLKQFGAVWWFILLKDFLMKNLIEGFVCLLYEFWWKLDCRCPLIAFCIWMMKNFIVGNLIDGFGNLLIIWTFWWFDRWEEVSLALNKVDFRWKR